MDFTRVETAEIPDAELDNVAGGVAAADVAATADADIDNTLGDGFILKGVVGSLRA